MRNDKSKSPAMSEAKIQAIMEILGLDPTGFNEIHDRLIQTEDQSHLIVTPEERQGAEIDVFFMTLESAELPFLREYIPHDLDPEIMMKYVSLVMEDPEVDSYTTCRMLQQLIDYERYLSDMFGTDVDSSQSPLTSIPVQKVTIQDQDIYVISLDVDPAAKISAVCEEMKVSMLHITEENESRFPLANGKDLSVTLLEIHGHNLEDLLDQTRTLINNIKGKAENDAKETYLYVACTQPLDIEVDGSLMQTMSIGVACSTVAPHRT